MDRKSLTFEEAEGVHPLPSQLDRTQLTQRVRATLWTSFVRHVGRDRANSDWLAPIWYSILRDEYAFHQYRPVDEFRRFHYWSFEYIKNLIFNGGYAEVFGFVQWVVRHPNVPKEFIADVTAALIVSRSAYRLIDGDTLVPTTDPLAVEALEQALAATHAAGLGGVRTHLSRAIDEITADQYAQSVRESIHAVEAVAVLLAPGSKTLGTALAKLEVAGVIHEAMKKGFSALYGYANDERGIRHSLLDQDTANVNEAEALFMLGACAAFVSYLIAKGRAAGLLA